MTNKFTIPNTSYFGAGALQSAMADICKLGKKALIVAGSSMIKQGHVALLTNQLAQNNVGHCIFSEISGEPTDTMIEAGLEVYRKENCDFIIGFGGGSPLDSAKAIGALATNGGNITDYNGKEVPIALPPLVAIPSTAGTGSEVTQFTIITDTKRSIKMLIKGTNCLPDMAVVDANFTMATPPSITAATGLDALTHAIEAYTSKKAFSITDLYAISAIKRIFKYLPICYKDGSDVKAREEMAMAAYEAGICINNSSVTLVHGMSRPIGAIFHVPHGMSNAILLKECLSFALEGAYDRFARLAREIGVASTQETDEAAAFKFLAAVGQICQVLNVPTLAGYGIDKEEFFQVIDKMAMDGYNSGSPSNTIRDITVEDIKEIYRKLW